MRPSFLVLSLAVLSACSTEMPPPTTAAPATATVATGSTAATEATGLGPLINAFRAENGKGPLNASPSLTLAAERHVQDMVANGYFSHTGLNGSNVGQRINAAGCRWTSAAENIAQGQTTAEATMTSWVNSSAHRANLLGSFTSYGAARAGNTWVLVFASGC